MESVNIRRQNARSDVDIVTVVSVRLIFHLNWVCVRRRRYGDGRVLSNYSNRLQRAEIFLSWMRHG